MSAPCHLAFDVVEGSRVGEVRRTATQLAQAHGFDETACGQVAIVATELANNLVRHAQGGCMLIGVVEAEDGASLIELLSLDRGPGIANVAASLSDGFSTGGTSGTGLGAVERLSQVFDLYTQPGKGSIILSRLSATGRRPGAHVPAPVTSQAYAVGAIRLCAPGEAVCGDDWFVTQDQDVCTLFVADGLGHGPQAQEAANAAIDVALPLAGQPPSQVLERVHQALRSTRGAAVAMATVRDHGSGLDFCGVGNIAGRIISGVGDRSLLSQHGTAGLQIRRLQDIHYEVPPHSLVLLHSDGIATRWKFDDEPGLLQHHPSVIAGWLMRDHLRGRDDATVVILKRQLK